MKQSFISYRTAAWAGLLLSLPTAYFFLISILKFELNTPGLYDAIEPSLQSLGLREDFGWNINLLILFGPVLALLLNVFSVLHIRFETTKEKIDCRVSINKSWKNLAVVLLSGIVLLILFAYLFVENCNCH